MEAAKELGDILVVSLTLDAHVNKGPDRPIHPWSHRAEMLRALRCVDDVVPSASAFDAILNVRPDIFVKGKDYAGVPMPSTLEACQKIGCELRILDTPKLSSTAIYDRLRQS